MIGFRKYDLSYCVRVLKRSGKSEDSRPLRVEISTIAPKLSITFVPAAEHGVPQ